MAEKKSNNDSKKTSANKEAADKEFKRFLKSQSTRESADKRTQENTENINKLLSERNDIEKDRTVALAQIAKHEDDAKKSKQTQLDYAAKIASAEKERHALASTYNDLARDLSAARKDMTRDQRIAHGEEIKHFTMAAAAAKEKLDAALESKEALETNLKNEQEHYNILEEQYNTNVEFNKGLVEGYDTVLQRNKAEEDHIKLLQDAGDKVDTLLDGYMEELDFLGDIDTFIKKIPGGELVSKIFGFDGVEKMFREKIVKQLMDAQVAGKGLGKIMAGWGGLLAGIAIGAVFVNYLLEADKEMVQLAKDMGISKDAAIDLEHTAQGIAEEMSVIGVRGKDVVATFVALKQETGLNYEELAKTNAAAKGIVETTTLLMTKMGLTAAETEGMSHAAMVTGVEMSALTVAAQSMGDELVSSKDLMKEVGKVSKGVLNTFRGNPVALLKAVKHAKMLGMTLDEAHASGKKLLDVESSMEAEMKSNVLTGRHINMNKARELALMGKTDEYLEEVDRQMGSQADYAKMLPFQQEAFAEGLGKSKDELDAIMAKKEKLELLGVNQAQLDAKMKLTGKDREAEMKRMLSLKGKDAADALQAQYAQLDQNELTKQFADSMAGITDGVKSALLPALKVVSRVMGSIAQFAKDNTIAFGIILGIVSAIAAAWVGMSAVKAIKGKLKDFGIGGKEATPDAQSFKAAKGSNKGLEDMSKGLQSMGQGGVEQGAANLKSAGPGLMAANMSKKFLKFIGQTKLKELETNFKNLSEGLKKMADTKSGSASLLIYGVAALIANLGNGFTKFMGQTKLKDLEKNFTALSEGLKKMADTKMGSLALGIFAVAGVLALASIPFLLVFGKVELPTLETNFTSLAAGLKLMADTKMGSLALGIFAVAGVLAIPSLIFLLVFGKVELGSLAANFTALSEGLLAMVPTMMGSLALGAFALAGALAIPSLIFLAGIALLGSAAAAGLTALGTGLLALGTVAATGIPFIAVALIAAIGVAMIPFAVALLIATPAIEAFGNVMVKVFEGLALIIGAVADGISKIISTVAESIKSLATLNGPNMLAVAAGIVALGVAIAGFGGGSLLGGIAKGIGDFFGGDPATNFKKFESISGAKLLQTANAILALSAAIKQFSSVAGGAINTDAIESTIDKVLDLHAAITKSPLEKVMQEVVSGVGDVFSTAGKWVASVIPGLESIDSTKSKETAAAAPNPNSEIVVVLNKILAATSSPVKINIGTKVIEEIGRLNRLQKTFTAKIDQSYGANG